MIFVGCINKQELIKFKCNHMMHSHKRVWMGGSTCRLSVKIQFGSRLKFSIFVGSRLNFLIFVGCRKISVNKKKRLLITNILFCLSSSFKTLIPKERVKLVRNIIWLHLNLINSCLFMQHDRLFHHCLANEYHEYW